MIKNVIFDVDGVLLDSFEANFEFFQKLMMLAGYPSPTRKQFTSLFHRTFSDTIRILIGSDDKKELERITHLMGSVESQSPRLMDNAAKTIEILSKNYTLAIVTSRHKHYAYEPPLDVLKKYFKVTVAFENTEKHKPDPEPLFLAARQLEATLSECVYIGDVKNDLVAATAAGMKFILLSKEKLENVEYWTYDFSELPSLIERIT